MSAKKYTTLQDIYEDAGLATAGNAEVPAGEVDGTNKVFTTPNKPLVDSDYDDEVTIADVQVYVDGSPVPTTAVNAQYGNITLATAPAEGSIVTVDYRYSATNMIFVSKLRDEAEEFINNRMRLVDACVPYGQGSNEVPFTVRNLTRQLAAAWLLIREYGYNQDIEGTSKDGYKRLETVKLALEEFAESGGACDNSEGGGSSEAGVGGFQSASEGDLFPEPDFRHEGASRPPKDW